MVRVFLPHQNLGVWEEGDIAGINPEHDPCPTNAVATTPGPTCRSPQTHSDPGTEEAHPSQSSGLGPRSGHQPRRDRSHRSEHRHPLRLRSRPPAGYLQGGDVRDKSNMDHGKHGTPLGTGARLRDPPICGLRLRPGRSWGGTCVDTPWRCQPIRIETAGTLVAMTGPT